MYRERVEKLFLLLLLPCQGALVYSSYTKRASLLFKLGASPVPEISISSGWNGTHTQRRVRGIYGGGGLQGEVKKKHRLQAGAPPKKNVSNIFSSFFLSRQHVEFTPMNRNKKYSVGNQKEEKEKKHLINYYYQLERFFLFVGNCINPDRRWWWWWWVSWII